MIILAEIVRADDIGSAISCFVAWILWFLLFMSIITWGAPIGKLFKLLISTVIFLGLFIYFNSGTPNDPSEYVLNNKLYSAWGKVPLYIDNEKLVQDLNIEEIRSSIIRPEDSKRPIKLVYNMHRTGSGTWHVSS